MNNPNKLHMSVTLFLEFDTRLTPEQFFTVQHCKEIRGNIVDAIQDYDANHVLAQFDPGSSVEVEGVR